MNFLEAHKLVAGFAGGPPLPFLLAMSGTPDKLDLFLRAAGAQRGRSATPRTLSFNTLAQTLLTEPNAGEPEVFVLFPWDFISEADWRSGFPTATLDEGALRARAQMTADQIARRRAAGVLYVPVPLPPLFPNPAQTITVERWLLGLASGLGASILPPETFSLGSYLSNGSPFAGTQLGMVAEAIVACVAATVVEPRKVLVTDLDNVLWHGVIGEDGLEGIQYGPEGVGFRHFLYQTFLMKLKHEGTLLAAVSRNDDELANGPFRSGHMPLGSQDFVVIVASYNAKSAQIKQIAQQLNLGLESFVFVDDNPIEVAEVSAALPGTTVVQFPPSDDALPGFFQQVAALFPRTTVTSEDIERTEMYRRRLEGMVPTDAAGTDLTAFLRDLQMSLVIHDRSQGERARAVQLINKTNQFNLNGRRVSDEEVGGILAAGGRLYTASLTDRTGSHGEILAALIDAEHVVRSLVMSCRVFQRHAEFAFFAWLAGQPDAPGALDFVETPRNEPVRQFLRDSAFTGEQTGAGIVQFDSAAFARTHATDLELFSLRTPADSEAAAVPANSSASTE
ncbi:MAG TPA: HAD-IIIC family phosphatase [Gemmatimonadaceae bacterium]|jgi:FkbH-like protein|nr:HAD-IIIC family phosphatase [Gemmatimonadaceae bacterium]